MANRYLVLLNFLVYSNSHSIFKFKGKIKLMAVIYNLEVDSVLQKMILAEQVNFLNLSKLLELCSNHFPNWLCQPDCINKDPTIWIDGARPA